MGHEPITYCMKCGEPFDVYRAPEDRVCDGCKEVAAERLAAGRAFAQAEAASLAGNGPAPNVPDDIAADDPDFRRGYEDYLAEMDSEAVPQ